MAPFFLNAFTLGFLFQLQPTHPLHARSIWIMDSQEMTAFILGTQEIETPPWSPTGFAEQKNFLQVSGEFYNFSYYIN